MKLLKYVLYAFGGLILVCVIAIAVLISIVDGAFLKNRLERQMKDEYKRTLVIEGTPNLSLFPSLALDLGRTRLSEPGSEKTFLSLESLKIAVRVMPLMGKSLQIDALALSGFRVNVVRAKDGTMNFDDLAGKTGKHEAAESGHTEARGKRPAIHLAGAKVENFEVTYRDESTGQSIAVSVPSLEVGPIADPSGGAIAFRADIKGTKPLIDVKMSLGGKMRLDLAKESFELSGLAFEAKGGLDRDTLNAAFTAPEVKVASDKATGSGIAGSLTLKGPQRSVEGKLNVSAIEGSAAALSISALTLDLNANLEGNGIRAHVETPIKASLTAKTWELPAVIANLTLSGPAIPQKTVTFPLRAAIKADLAKQSASADISTKFDESTIKAKFSASKLRPMHANFDLNVDRLNLDRYLSETSAGGAKPDKPIDLSALKGPQVEGKVQIGALQIKQAKLQNIKAGIKLSGGKLEVPHYSAGLYTGTLEGRLAADANTNHFQLANKMNGVFIGPLLRDVAKKDLLEGRGNVSLDVETTGTIVPALKRALAGSAKIELKDGAIKGINLAESLRNFKTNLGSRSGQSGNDSGKKTDFSEMSASFAIKNGVARNEDLKAASPFLRLAGAGTIDIGNSSLDYLAKATLAATTKGQGGPADALGLTVPVKLTGPLDKPNWNIDFSGVLGAVGGNAGKLTEQLKSVTGAAGGGVKDKLKGLFGR